MLTITEKTGLEQKRIIQLIEESRTKKFNKRLEDLKEKIKSIRFDSTITVYETSKVVPKKIDVVEIINKVNKCR